jgi:lysyl endopeptidase
MNRYLYLLVVLTFVMGLLPNFVSAQISKPSTPLSILDKKTLPEALALAQPDWARVREEDRKMGSDFRFAAPTDVNFTPQNSGIWTKLPSGDRLWQLHLSSEKALGLALGLEAFELPKGAKLYLFSPDGTTQLGAYDSDNNNAGKQFFIGFTQGKAAILEYFEPKTAFNSKPFVITKAYHAYEQSGLLGTGFGMSLACNINVNCAEGANWQAQKRGVVRIRVVVTQGVGWCSGSLMNNTKQDGTPYVLTAFHCTHGFNPIYGQWTFFFNYESPNCANPTTEPALQSVQGCVYRSGAEQTDFQLVELTERVPTAFNPHFNGWNRDSSQIPNKITIIHHPQGDIKKITIDNDQPTVLETEIVWPPLNVVSPPRSHLQLVPDRGTTEAGSSGSPYFDENGRVVAQNHGGLIWNVCAPTSLEGGWLAKSWNGNGTPATRLKDWLDPVSSNAMILDGTSTPVATAQVSGNLKTWWGINMPNQKIVIGADSTTTDANGNFSFPALRLNVLMNMQISRNINPLNGVDALDMLRIRRHLLGVAPISVNTQLFSADVDDSGEVDALDMLALRRLILGITPNLATSSWRFVPASVVANPAFPAGVQVPSIIPVTFSSGTSSLNFIGVKMGDVDGTADTNQ